MAVVNLNDCFPVASDGSRGPLPKQGLFLRKVLDPQGPSYVMFSGGVGNGKTLVGCIAILSMAVQKSGDYLVCRQFSPELSITTRKQFLEVVPKELIKEYRIADGIVRIKAADGGISNVIFRPAEEPEKFRSLNLNAAYIDESSQVSEECFDLLISRLRGKAFRKILLTTNPNGHTWQYRRFVANQGQSPTARARYFQVSASSIENRHLPDGYVAAMLENYSKERAEREIYGSWDAFQGMIYNEFDRSLHVVKPFAIPSHWTRVMGRDHGYRNPSAAVWGAIDPDDNIYIYREYYQRERLIKEICDDLVVANKGEKLEGDYVDPSISATRGQTGLSDWDEYLEHLPRTWPMVAAQNDVALGIDRVKNFLKADPRTQRPRLYIFDTCEALLEEITQYRWKERPMGQSDTSAEKEEPVKVNDHALDALRYLIMSRPEGPRPDKKRKEDHEPRTAEWHLRQELAELRKPKSRDPFGDL